MTSLCPEDAPPPSRVHWGRLSLSETVRGWTPRARWCGRENGPRGGSLPARPRGPGGLTLPPESRSHLHLLFSVLSMAQAPSLGPRGVSQTQESLTRDRVLSVLSGGCTPDAAPAQGHPLWTHRPETLISVRKLERSLPRCSAVGASDSPGSCCLGGCQSRPPGPCVPPSRPRAKPPLQTS